MCSCAVIYFVIPPTFINSGSQEIKSLIGMCIEEIQTVMISIHIA